MITCVVCGPLRRPQTTPVLGLPHVTCSQQLQITWSTIIFFLTQKENISSQSFRINKSQSFLAQKKNVSALMRVNQIFFIHQQQLDHKTTPITVSHSHAFSIWSLILNFITLNFIQAIRKEWNLKSFILLSDYILNIEFWFF